MEKISWKKFFGFSDFDYPVPDHANSFAYLFGGLAGFCFLITFVTGFVMTQFYSPSPVTAYDSVRYINFIPWLKFIRSLHYWSANLGFAILIVHMVRVLLTGAYRPPRVFTYLIGVGLLFITFQIYFTGTVLKWDQEGYEGLSHFIALNKLLGPLGNIFLEDFTLSTPMLSRFYALHIGIFPILFIFLIVTHAFLIKKLGISPRPYQSENQYAESLKQGNTFLGHTKKLTIFSLVLMAVLVVLAIVIAPELGHAPKAGIEITKPPWPFWIFYPIESVMGISGILIGSILVGAYLLSVPIFSMIISKEKTILKTVNIITIIALIIWFVMMVMTYLSPVMSHM
ncbi:MAG: hypothetical protein HOG03_16500 [Desulfobacula sp.]|jgi:quinol-cytochrome oxidoreductase complex cytochrome b subunit|uniref:cytochrome b N-terminal domain-containing protein n=1 Tax=Desulfobacula sp. TaxID=2593537 RepID=UPI001D7D6015|nr:hypothetical protein [Desulfobacula sp.]MBT3484331.1 hypothetical protein [Desulfobacula sp.]MBT3806180.1 hypothetical protein [Desulfobacula sp.]MBT4024140.1 hypothetical protein [Desulfobacula sp.]MBT4197464.1 hypothetical protein [Desulfobacula sp.]